MERTRMERRSRRRRTLRRHKQPLPPSDLQGVEGSYQAPQAPQCSSDCQPSNTSSPPPHAPVSSTSTRRVEMVARIRAEGRNIAPEALTKHHLATTANKNGENKITTESPKAKEEPNLVSGLIKRLSDQTKIESVCPWQNVKKFYSNLAKMSLQ